MSLPDLVDEQDNSSSGVSSDQDQDTHYTIQVQDQDIHYTIQVHFLVCFNRLGAEI